MDISPTAMALSSRQLLHSSNIATLHTVLHLYPSPDHMATTQSLHDEFQYQPFDRAQEGVQIRLVTLLPGEGSDQIVCTLQHNTSPPPKNSRFKASIPYEALSYVWGPPEITRNILLNGKLFSVRDNLWAALSQLRFADRERTLWIDALCINQEDVQEKNAQVSQMGVVYASSQSVLIWLGREELKLDGRNALQIVKDILTLAPKLVDKVFWAGLAEDWKARPHGDDWNTNRPEWFVLEKLCGLEYWTRLWIVQEVVLGYRITLCWGAGSLEWYDIQNVLDKISRVEEDEEYGMTFRQTSEAVTGSILFGLCRRKLGGGKALYFSPGIAFDLLCEFRESKCFDIRDMVFGLRGISRSIIPVEYSKSAFELCGEVLKDKFLKNHPCGDLSRYGDRFTSVWKGSWDMANLDVISHGEFVHKLLLGSNMQPKSILASTHYIHQEDSDDSGDSRRIDATGNISGAICFVTEVLEFYRQQPLEAIERSLRQDLLVSNLIPQLKKRLCDLGQFLDERYSEWSEAFRNSAENRCYAVSKTASYGEEPPHQNYASADTQLITWQKEKWEGKWQETKKAWMTDDAAMGESNITDGLAQLPTPEEIMAELISAVTESIDLDPANRTKLFISTNGLIGFASKNIAQGDVICTFRQSQTLVIARAEGNRYELMGLATSINRDTGNEPLTTGMMSKDQVPERMIRFHFDIETLQLLCSFDCMHSVGVPILEQSSGRRKLNPYF